MRINSTRLLLAALAMLLPATLPNARAAFSHAIANSFDLLTELGKRRADPDDRDADFRDGDRIFRSKMTRGSTQIFSVTSPTQNTSAASAASSKVS